MRSAGAVAIAELLRCALAGPTWAARCTRMLRVEPKRLAAAARYPVACERLAISLDDGIGTAAIAAITTPPTGPQRDLEIAVWASGVAAGPRRVAFVIPDDITDEQIEIIARLAERVRTELGGGL